YSVALDRVSVRGPGKGRLDGIAMAPGTFADDVTIQNSDFAEMGVVVAATSEQEPKGWYPMERLTITGSRFARVAMVAHLLRKGTDESTFGP
ncbi:MAG: poly(beta-D-mannuronate) lyase, partial [Nevskia sp.]